MARRFTYGASLSWGGDIPTAELEVEVSYTVTWGSPPRFSMNPELCDEGSPSVVEDIRVETIDGLPLAEALKRGSGEYMPGETVRLILEKLEMDHEGEMIQEAAESLEPGE